MGKAIIILLFIFIILWTSSPLAPTKKAIDCNCSPQSCSGLHRKMLYSLTKSCSRQKLNRTQHFLQMSLFHIHIHFYIYSCLLQLFINNWKQKTPLNTPALVGTRSDVYRNPFSFRFLQHITSRYQSCSMSQHTCMHNYY